MLKSKVCVLALSSFLLLSCSPMQAASSSGSTTQKETKPNAPAPTNASADTFQPKTDTVIGLWNRYIRLGELAVTHGEFPAGIKMYQQALGEAQLLGTGDSRYTATLNKLADVYVSMKDFEHAEATLKQAVTAADSAGTSNPLLAGTLFKLAEVYREENKDADAAPLLERAIKLGDSSSDTTGSAQQDTNQARIELADIYQIQGKTAEAENLFKPIVSSGEPDKVTIPAFDAYALILCKSNRFSDAEQILSKVLAAQEKLYGHNSAEVAGTLNNQAEVYRTENKYAEAEPLYKSAIEIWETIGPNKREYAAVLGNLALLYKAQNKFAEAKPLLIQALTIDQRTSGLYSIDVGMDLANLASVHQSLNEPGEAKIMYEQALPVLEKRLGADAPLVKETRKELDVLQSAGKTAEVKTPAQQ